MTTRAGVVLSALVAGSLVACNQPVTNLPTGPTVPTANGAEIIGPPTVPPGTPTQFTANVRLSDGKNKAPLPGTPVTWQSTNSSILRVDQNGLITPMTTQGEATITATIRLTTGGNRQGSRELIVQPHGTFRVVGKITDQELPTLPVFGARVEVESGTAFATTDANGNFRLYGVPASANLRITAPSYEPQVVPVQLSSNITRNVVLAFNGQRPNLPGDYTLTITGTGTNCGTMPAEFRTRQYDATITQSGTTFDVRLAGPAFRLSSAGRGSRFSGSLTGNGARFTLSWPDSYWYYFAYYYYLVYSPGGYASVVEAVSNNRYLVTRGTFTVVSSSSGHSGSGFGEMYLWDSRFPFTGARVLGICSGDTQFRLDPR